MTSNGLRAGFLGVGLSVLLMSTTACGAPKAEFVEGHPLTAKVTAGVRQGKGTFDHSDFDALLRKYVAAGNRVDYAGLKKDRPTLQKYLGRLATAKVETLSKEELLAFLINSYNAYTLDLIVEHYPVKSIRDIPNAWKAELYSVAGVKVSLDFIEHSLLRVPELFTEPRIHFGVNCASNGCPPLRPGAYTGPNVRKQLEETTRSALANPTYLQVKDGKVHVTEVLKWFGEDFVRKHGSVAKFLMPYVNEEAKKILAAGDGALSYLPYDWKLNDKSR